MRGELEEKLMRFLPFRWVVHFLEGITLPGFEGMSLHDLIVTYINGIVNGTFSARAGSIAFSFFMALFPALLFLLNLIPYIPIDQFQLKFMAFIFDLMPNQSEAFFRPIINDISLNQRGGLLSLSGVLALFLTANGVNAIFSGFEKSFHATIGRNFFRQYLISISVAIILASLLVTTVIVLVYLEYTLHMLRDRQFFSDSTDVFLLSAGKYTFFVLMLYSIIATLYYFGTKQGKESKFFSLGATMTTLLFLVTTYLFGVYIDNFSNYNELYGSIGALLIMMLYIWLNSNLLLLGFELNASMRKLKFKSNFNTTQK